MNIPSLSAIILTKNEQLHIRRCLENILMICEKIYVIDSFSTDETAAICAEYEKVKFIQHEWTGLYAEQFNWALAHCRIESDWILRIDADEFFMPEAIQELKDKLPYLPKYITGIAHKRRHIFLGKWMKHGVYPVKLIRIFRNGQGRCEQRHMDEHITLFEGSSVEFEYDFVDDNLHDISWWTLKHVDYARREMADIENMLLYPFFQDSLTGQACEKRILKERYIRQPLFLRSFAYFCYRYFFKLGFLDGKEGFLWHFLQGWWYRTLIDVNIYMKNKRK